MPAYDYKCRTCGEVTEIRHGFDERPEGGCPHCNGELARQFTAAPIIFKGSGYYVTDSRKSSASSGTDKPSDGAASDKPVAEKSSSEKPAAEKPSTDKPSSEKPSSDKPAGKNEKAA